jgi:hypothetical protein
LELGFEHWIFLDKRSYVFDLDLIGFTPVDYSINILDAAIVAKILDIGHKLLAIE